MTPLAQAITFCMLSGLISMLGGMTLAKYLKSDVKSAGAPGCAVLSIGLIMTGFYLGFCAGYLMIIFLFYLAAKGVSALDKYNDF